MNMPTNTQQMNKSTVDSLQELIHALKDNSSYLNQAADSVSGDELVANTLRNIAQERQSIHEGIGNLIESANGKPDENGAFLGNLRTVWTAIRAGLNAGDPTVVLIEAERAEDAILHKFKEILPEIAGNPANDQLLKYFEQIKQGHDLIRGYRDAYQSA